MERKTKRVKTKRHYDSTGRRSRAQRARLAVLDAAERLLLADGYGATTVVSIASAAGVSVETIYKGFGGKPGLVRAIRERRLAGRGPVHAETRSDRMRGQETDPRRLVAQWGKFTVEVAPLVSPILLLVREAAASDDEMAKLHQELEADRLRRMTVNARHLHAGGHLRDGVSLAQAADVMWTYTSPELYELLVLRRHWPVERYGLFVADALVGALLT